MDNEESPLKSIRRLVKVYNWTLCSPIKILNDSATKVNITLAGCLLCLVPMAVTGLIGGDDCHGRTPVAGAALVDELVFRSASPIDSRVLDFMRVSPSLFLNLWMAATKCMMIAASDVPDSAFVSAAGGNGRDVGIQVSGLPGRWFSVPASPPKGAFDVDVPEDRALGAIGDSAVVDAFGLGAMFAPPENVPPTDVRAGLSIGTHPYFRNLGIPMGSSANSLGINMAKTVIKQPMAAATRIMTEPRSKRYSS